MLKGKTPLIVALVLGLLAGVVAYSAIKKKEADVRRGWNLVPVVVASQDIPEGTVVTFDMISQRSVPEQFVTSSVVKPDSASYARTNSKKYERISGPSSAPTSPNRCTPAKAPTNVSIG